MKVKWNRRNLLRWLKTKSEKKKELQIQHVEIMRRLWCEHQMKKTSDTVNERVRELMSTNDENESTKAIIVKKGQILPLDWFSGIVRVTAISCSKLILLKRTKPRGKSWFNSDPQPLNYHTASPNDPGRTESTAYPTRSRRILEQKTNHQGSLTHSEVSAAPQASKTWGHEVHTSPEGWAESLLETHTQKTVINTIHLIQFKAGQSAIAWDCCIVILFAC